MLRQVLTMDAGSIRRSSFKKDVLMLDWKQLVLESDEQLASRDVAEIHFACAAGLPGAERIDIPLYLRDLDQYAWQVRTTTNRLWHVFEQKPEKFANSPAYFCSLVMATVFQRDLGFRTTGRANRHDYKLLDSRDAFLHGLIEVGMGSCASHPVLYAAVGRRLNYPIKLVTCPRHLFARWEEPGGERLNLECTSKGFFSHPDDYYLRWPIQATPEEVAGTYFLKSLSPREELAGFLIQRAMCLRDNDRYREAVESACYSHELAPHHRLHLETVLRLMRQWRDKLDQEMPPPYPALQISWPRRKFTKLPPTIQQEIVYLEVLDHLSKEPVIQAAYRRPIRRNPTTLIPLGLPEKMAVWCEEEGNIRYLTCSLFGRKS